jgi:hypothetical protein
MKAKLKPFVGKWIVVEMEAWDQDFVNMEVPGHFTFRKDGTGHFQFGKSCCAGIFAASISDGWRT